MNTKVQTTLIILITFIIGVLVGALGTGTMREERAGRFNEMGLQDRFHKHMEHIIQPTEEQKAAITDIEKIKQAKKDHREKVKAANQEGTTHNVETDDYYVTIAFNNNSEKHSTFSVINNQINQVILSRYG